MAVWLWNFWIFSFWGWCLERLFAAVTHSPRQRRRCLLVSPLCPVYGLGMAAVLALPAPLLSGWRLYFFGSLAATAVEYLRIYAISGKKSTYKFLGKNDNDLWHIGMFM